MATPAPQITNQQLLCSLPAASLDRLAPHLSHVELEHGNVLIEMEDTVKSMIFPDRDAMVSLLSVNEDGELIEVGMVGVEGMVGVNPLLGASKSSHRALVQVPGHGWKVKSDSIERAFSADPHLRSTTLRYVNFLMMQLSQTAL